MFNRDIKNKDVNEVSDGFVDDSPHSIALDLMRMADRFKNQLQAPECNLDELEVLTWDIVTDYVEKAEELCLQEMMAVAGGCNGMNPMDLFVTTQ